MIFIWLKQNWGHASIVMTEKYDNFDKRKLEEDFPSIIAVQSPQAISIGDTKNGA